MSSRFPAKILSKAITLPFVRNLFFNLSRMRLYIPLVSPPNCKPFPHSPTLWLAPQNRNFLDTDKPLLNRLQSSNIYARRPSPLHAIPSACGTEKRPRNPLSASPPTSTDAPVWFHFRLWPRPRRPPLCTTVHCEEVVFAFSAPPPFLLTF